MVSHRNNFLTLQYPNRTKFTIIQHSPHYTQYSVRGFEFYPWFIRTITDHPLTQQRSRHLTVHRTTRRDLRAQHVQKRHIRLLYERPHCSRTQVSVCTQMAHSVRACVRHTMPAQTPIIHGSLFCVWFMITTFFFAYFEQ